MTSALPTILRYRVTLNGIDSTGAPIERCNGVFDEVYLLLPGTGVYFLVSRERVQS